MKTYRANFESAHAARMRRNRIDIVLQCFAIDNIELANSAVNTTERISLGRKTSRMKIKKGSLMKVQDFARIVCVHRWDGRLSHTVYVVPPIVTRTMSTRICIHISLLYIIWSLPNGRSLRPPVFLGEWDPKLCLEEIQIGQRTEAQLTWSTIKG